MIGEGEQRQRAGRHRLPDRLSPHGARVDQVGRASTVPVPHHHIASARKQPANYRVADGARANHRDLLGVSFSRHGGDDETSTALKVKLPRCPRRLVACLCT